MGQEFITLPIEVWRLVLEDVRRELEKEDGGPIEVPMEVTFGSGRK